MDNKLETIKYEDGEINIDVRLSYDEETVWLTQKDLTLLFNIDKSRISRHIKNILEQEELDCSVVAENATTGSDGKTYITKYYNLDMISAVGYRVNTKKCKKFKEWASQQLHPKVQETLENTSLIRFEYGEISLDVNVSPDEDTVWLSQNDMSLLFETSKQNISLHIKNIFNENELDNSVVKDFFTTALDGKTYQTKMYNLDMIIAIGYRVNSKRGMMFRKWANKILKQYLLYGHAINEERCLSCTSNIISLQNEMNNIKSKMNNIYDILEVEKSKIFYQGEILDAYAFIRKLFFLAKKEIIITDYYADKFLLSILKDIKVNITIITSSSSYLNKEVIPNNIRIIKNEDIHGRYLFIDDKGYIIDNSFNNIGKKRLLIMKLDDTKEIILKGII